MNITKNYPNVVFSIEMIDSELAQKYLDSNFHNQRKLNKESCTKVG